MRRMYTLIINIEKLNQIELKNIDQGRIICFLKSFLQ